MRQRIVVKTCNEEIQLETLYFGYTLIGNTLIFKSNVFVMK